jgi:SDR family mycofactocin-dependent oxidoreductase
MGQLDGRVAFITGAGRGQGRSHAVALAEDGADIVAVDVCKRISDAIPYELATSDDLRETATLVEKTGRRCIAMEADVRFADQLRAAVDAGMQTFGRLDIVVANAGLMSGGPAWELSEEAWDVVMDVNLKGVWNTARVTVPHLIAGGGGSMILTSSAAGLRGHVGYAHYTASKHGVVGLTRALSNELGKHKIRVNSVHPTGVSETGITPGGSLEELVAREPLFGLAAMNTIADYVEPRDVSNAVRWLASDESRYVTGLQLTVDAGNTTKP